VEVSEKKNFDLVVLGGGPGGYTAAFRAADLGLDVCLIEKQERLGGVCLNVGCIPSKTLLHCAAVIEEAREIADFGVSFKEPEINLEAMREKKESIVMKLTGGLNSLAKARKVTHIKGYGVFQDKESIKVTDGEKESLVGFKNAIIATGSRPFILPGLPDDPRIWDSTAALELSSIPKRFLIIGGGIIGLEMAQVYHGLGSEVTIVEMLEHIIPPADKDMVQPLFQKLKKSYTILTKTKVTEVKADKKSLKVTIEGKQSETTEYDAVLVAVGRKPNSEDLGLESVGISPSDRGFIEVDEQQRSSAENIFAIGDVVGEPMLAHKATHQGKVAAEVIAGHKAAFSAMTIPSVAYTSPEVAWMGLTEKEAKEQNIDYEKGKFSWGASGRALASGAETGSSKVLFSKETGRIIGAAICGQNAGELIHEAVLALEMGADAEDISKTVHAHPTLAETFAFACEMVDGSLTDGMPQKKK
jgi:dihydrolipoamide dehydrogenase